MKIKSARGLCIKLLARCGRILRLKLGLKYLIASFLLFGFKFLFAQSIHFRNNHYNFQESQLNRNKPKEIQKNILPRFHLDSIVNYRFQKDLNRYVCSSKTIFYEVGTEGHGTVIRYSGNKVEEITENYRRYDSKGRSILWVSKTNYSNKNFGYRDSVSFVYNDSNNSYIRYSILDNNDTSKTFNLFDTKNRNIKFLRYKYNSSLQNWEHNIETQNVYNDKDYLAESNSKIYDLSNKVWIEKSKTIYNYNSNDFIKDIVEYSFDNFSKGYFIKGKTEFLYDSKNNIASIEEYQGDINNGLCIHLKYNYEYDSLNRLIYNKVCLWNDYGDFINCDGYDLMYNQEGALFNTDIRNYSNQLGWIPSRKEYYVYDSKMKLNDVTNRIEIGHISRASPDFILKEYMIQDFRKNEYVNSIKVVYYYSKIKHKTRLSQFLNSLWK
jgi:hypothetical protein